MSSIFPFTIQDPVREAEAEDSLTVFKELAYDYENNCLLRRGGKPYLIEKDEALKVWIYKALKTKRFAWQAYSHTYGTEMDNVIGVSNDPKIIDSEIKRYIIETLMVNPYIQELSDFSFEHELSAVTASYTVTTIYGRFTHESEVYNE
ncbi:MAG: DUF2634 domain-containing protein [Butyrivibrio sp.]|nr:DUF2634 domain-containing protein [Butyrivibrio sp.]